MPKNKNNASPRKPTSRALPVFKQFTFSNNLVQNYNSIFQFILKLHYLVPEQLIKIGVYSTHFHPCYDALIARLSLEKLNVVHEPLSCNGQVAEFDHITLTFNSSPDANIKYEMLQPSVGSERFHALYYQGVLTQSAKMPLIVGDNLCGMQFVGNSLDELLARKFALEENARMLSSSESRHFSAELSHPNDMLVNTLLERAQQAFANHSFYKDFSQFIDDSNQLTDSASLKKLMSMPFIESNSMTLQDVILRYGDQLVFDQYYSALNAKKERAELSLDDYKQMLTHTETCYAPLNYALNNASNDYFYIATEIICKLTDLSIWTPEESLDNICIKEGTIEPKRVFRRKTNDAAERKFNNDSSQQINNALMNTRIELQKMQQDKQCSSPFKAPKLSQNGTTFFQSNEQHRDDHSKMLSSPAILENSTSMKSISPNIGRNRSDNTTALAASLTYCIRADLKELFASNSLDTSIGIKLF